jgi:hypothetical protein
MLIRLNTIKSTLQSQSGSDSGSGSDITSPIDPSNVTVYGESLTQYPYQGLGDIKKSAPNNLIAGN